eukprot:2640180-Prymnesium_polylepis.2
MMRTDGLDSSTGNIHATSSVQCVQTIHGPTPVGACRAGGGASGGGTPSLSSESSTHLRCPTVAKPHSDSRRVSSA